jgi:TetR/AcrR family transcriptional repressor of mexJK operon
MSRCTGIRALRGIARKLMDIFFAKETIELHRIVIAECRRFPKLGRLFYQRGPGACIDEEFLDLICGYPHLRVLLGVEKAPSRSEMRSRVESAVRHVLG